MANTRTTKRTVTETNTESKVVETAPVVKPKKEIQLTDRVFIENTRSWNLGFRAIESQRDITIPAKDAADAYNKAVNTISKYVNIDGFRKGKAPRAVVERHVGTERIKQEAIEKLKKKHNKDGKKINFILSISEID